MSDKLTTKYQEYLSIEILDRLRGTTTHTQKTQAPPLKLVTEVDRIATAQQKEFAEITGVSHPKGKFYFTVFNDTDWDKRIRQFIPETDKNFMFDPDFALSVLMSLEFDKPLFVYGPPGCGKSETPEQICARVRRPFKFIAGMAGTEPSDYVGHPWVKDGSMEWVDGDLSFAVRHGLTLLYDEPFKASAQTNMCIQSLMDGRRTLKLYGHPDTAERSLIAHKNFRIILADNVRGDGSDMQRYATDIQDQSTLNRMSYKMQLDYMEADTEINLLTKLFPKLNEEMINRIVKLANLLRAAYNKEEATSPFSIRNTKEWAEATLYLGDPELAFRMTYYNNINDGSERTMVDTHWSAVFGDTQHKLG